MQLAAVTWQLWQCELERSKPWAWEAKEVFTVSSFQPRGFPKHTYQHTITLATCSCYTAALTVRSWKTHAQVLLGLEKQKTFSRQALKNPPRGIPEHIYQDTITQYMQLAALLWWLAAVTVRTWNIHTQSLFLPGKQKTFSQQALACHEVTPAKTHP